MNKTEVENILQQAGFSGYAIEQTCALGNLSEIKTPNQLASIVSRTYLPLGNNNNMTAIDLLKRPAFQLACQVSLVLPSSPLEFAEISSPLKHLVFYGSTSGLNIAELLETSLCADFLNSNGVPATVVFDHSGHNSQQASKIRADSVKSMIPDSNQVLFNSFLATLGKNAEDQTIAAAKMLTGNRVTFVKAEQIAESMGQKLNLFRLCVLAKISGNDPFVTTGKRASELLSNLSFTELLLPFGKREDLAGFSLYARDAILGSDPNCSYGVPLKLTDKANIYFLLEREKALLGQKKPDSGVLVMPITRHRIQTPTQIALQTGDPVDPTVLAYLAQREPSSWQKLVTEFTDSCQVLTPDQAIQKGTGDVRFNIANYFNL